MNIAADEKKVVCLCFFDQLHETFLLVRVVCPGFVAVVFDAELCATCDDAAVCRLEKFLFEPCPLFFTKHGLTGILGGQVVEGVERVFVFSALGIPWDRVPKAPSIEENDLDDFLANLAGHRMIDALVLVA